MKARDVPGCRISIGLVLLAAVILAACGRSTASPALTAVPLPTLAPVFSVESATDLPATAQPTPASPTATPRIPLATATTAATPETPAVQETALPPELPTRVSGELRPLTPVTSEIPIYTDKLSPGWSLKSSVDMTYNERSTTFVYTGTAAVLAQPAKPWSQLIFGVTKDSQQLYRRDRILGVRFRVSSSTAVIPTDGLVVTVYGSKLYPYYVPDDRSATRPEGRVTTDDPLFPETRLYFLDVNRDIEPGEWVEIVVWLDQHFTPDYTYVTALSIKNDEKFLQPFSVDDVSLITETF